MSVISIVLCIETGTIVYASMILVNDGKPTSIIVIADKPTVSARRGADELQFLLNKISGATIPILSERKLPKDTNDVLILVGDTERTINLGLRSRDFELEESRVKTFPNMLVLIGNDQRPDGIPLLGTLWAVDIFCEQFLGVRVLWPGELGQVIPKSPTVKIGEANVRYVPVLCKRGIRNIGYNDRVQKGLDMLNWNADEFKRHQKESGLWFQFNRIGGSFHGTYGHSFGKYWKRFHIDHPEWFALQPDGTRYNSTDGGINAPLCVSNQELIKQVASDCITALSKDVTLDTVSISLNDGTAFCLCEPCAAWDAQDGEMIKIQGIPHVSLTDRYVKFYSAVAEIVAKELPDRYLGAYAYDAYSLPPVHAKLHPNVVIGFVGFSYLDEEKRQKARDSWLKWSQVAKRMFLRPNLLTSGWGLPTVYVHRLAEDIRFCVRNGMLFADFDCCYQNWATDGINYYVLAKLLSDPDVDVDAIVDDYCRAGFGNASESVREYFRQLEDMTTNFALSNTKSKPVILAQCYTDEFLAKCNTLLDEADQRAGDEIVRQRVAFLRKAIEYARIRRDWTMAKHEKRKDIETERDAWYQQLGMSWALNAAYLRAYGY